MNPFTETPSGDIVCVDAKVNFDDNAAFRQARLTHTHLAPLTLFRRQGQLRRQRRLPPGPAHTPPPPRPAHPPPCPAHPVSYHAALLSHARPRSPPVQRDLSPPAAPVPEARPGFRVCVEARPGFRVCVEARPGFSGVCRSPARLFWCVSKPRGFFPVTPARSLRASIRSQPAVHLRTREGRSAGGASACLTPPPRRAWRQASIHSQPAVHLLYRCRYGRLSH